jgi:Protein of unknown function (DUF3102)
MTLGPDTVDWWTMTAAAINAEHEQATAAIATGTAHAIRAGELLIEAKDKRRHGDWSAWCQANLSFGSRTAQLYMQLARLEPEKRNAVSDLALRRALLKLRADKRAEDEARRRTMSKEEAEQRARWAQEARDYRNSRKIDPANIVVSEPPQPEPDPEDILADLFEQLLWAVREAGISKDELIDALCCAFDLIPRGPVLARGLEGLKGEVKQN